MCCAWCSGSVPSWSLSTHHLKQPIFTSKRPDSTHCTAPTQRPRDINTVANNSLGCQVSAEMLRRVILCVLHEIIVKKGNHDLHVKMVEPVNHSILLNQTSPQWLIIALAHTIHSLYSEVVTQWYETLRNIHETKVEVTSPRIELSAKMTNSADLWSLDHCRPKSVLILLNSIVVSEHFEVETNELFYLFFQSFTRYTTISSPANSIYTLCVIENILIEHSRIKLSWNKWNQWRKINILKIDSPFILNNH